MIRTCIAFVTTLVLAATAAASDNGHLRPDGPRIVVATPVEQPVLLEAVRVHADIRGSLAVTSVEMRFHNPNRRQLEGELQFPLLPGQRVIGMALDVNGRLRDAVAVDKARGQEIFEEVRRARIDPALLEVTQGENYKLRVYPIPADGRRTVVIRYLESLPARHGEFRYRLPMTWSETLASFELTATVADRPSRVTKPETFGALAFERAGRHYATRVTRERFHPGGVLEFAIPASDRPRVHTQTLDGKTWFYAEVPVADATMPRPKPRSVGILWDSSGSAASRDRGREFDLLERYFRNAGNVDVRLTRFRDVAEPTETFAVRNGDWQALRRALERTVHDGATDMGALTAVLRESSVDEWLLFSDGLANYGATRLTAPAAPLHAVSSSARIDSALLRAVSEASGGRHLDLLDVGAAGAAERLTRHGIRIAALGGSGVTQLVAASPFPENGVLRLAGEIVAPDAELRIELRIPGGKSRSQRVRISGDDAESPHAAFMWASLRVAELEGDHRANRSEILRIGKAWSLATRETSLIVLERIEDYVRYALRPPAELAAEYDRRVAVARQRDVNDRQAQIERVVTLFNEKRAWWSRDFPKGDRPAAIALDGNAAAERRAGPADDRARAPAAAPAPMMAAPRSAARLAESSGSGSAAKRDAAASASAGDGASIQLRRWTSDAPYIRRFAAAAPDEIYGVYLDERANHPNSTAFLLDAADQLLDRGMTALGLRVLSNLAEMDLENRHILRILAYRLLQARRPDLAIPLFERVIALAPDEPQSGRDLGLAYAADRQYQKAVDTLYGVVARPWHGRFPEVELIVLAELNAAVAEAERNGVRVDTGRIDPRLRHHLPLDLRVVLTWDADDTDIDLWVTDPNGDKAYYGNRLTYQGGRNSPDFTGGYGPEEFSLRNAKPGKYVVHANFYGHRRQTVAGATTLQVKFITGFGTAKERTEIATLRLRERAETVLVGEFEVK